MHVSAAEGVGRSQQNSDRYKSQPPKNHGGPRAASVPSLAPLRPLGAASAAPHRRPLGSNGFASQLLLARTGIITAMMAAA